MNVKSKKERLIMSFMVLVPIRVLFGSSVAFGDLTDPSFAPTQKSGGVHGTASYSDCKPVPLNDLNNGTFMGLFNFNNNSLIDTLTTDKLGSFTSENQIADGHPILKDGVMFLDIRRSIEESGWL